MTANGSIASPALPAPSAQPVTPVRQLRADIQGLRMVAVVIVLVFHLAPGILPGGFVGVDVFFVISGYLITSIIAAERAATGSFRVRRFFARRARRLVPLAGAVVSATMAAAFVFLPSTAWEQVGRDALASVLQLENWNLVVAKADYLHPGHGPSVLQNFWSLSVEWQDYLVWALILGILLSRAVRAPRVATWTLVALTALSLGASVVITSGHPGLAYFGTPTRLWEFGAGALAATWHPSLIRRLHRELVGWAGIAAILLSAVVFTSTTPFPGIAAALPVAGTVAILISGGVDGPASWSRLLGRRGAVYLGDRSYAIYLWHWPVLILIEWISGRAGGVKIAILACAVTLALAVVTTRLIERPVRASSHPRRVAMALVIWMALPLVLGGSAVAQAASARAALNQPADPAHPGAAALAGHPDDVEGSGPIAPSLQAVAADYGPAGVGDRCLHVVALPVSCTFGDLASDRLVVLTGDSHAWQWIPALELLGKRYGFRVETLVRPSCPLAPTGVDIPGIGDDGSCGAWRVAAVSRILSEHPMAVIVGGLTPAGYEGIDYHVAPFPDFIAGYRALWQTFAGARIPVVMMRDVPYFAVDVPQCVAGNPTHPADCREPRSRVLDAYPDPLVAATGPGAHLIDLTDSICLPTVCPAVAGNVLVYRDRDHLTATYVRTLAPMLWAQLTAMPPFDGQPVG